MFGLALNFFLLVPVTVLLVAERYDASLAIGGASAGALLVGAVASRPFTGLLLHGRSLRSACFASAVVMTLSGAGLLLPVPLSVFIALRVVTGIAFAVGSTVSLTLAVEAVSPLRRGEATGYFGLANSLAGAIGPAAGLALAHRISYDAVIWAVVAASALATLCSLLLADSRNVEAGATARGVRRFLEPRVFAVAAVILLVGIPFSGLFGFVDPFVQSRGLDGAGTTFFLAYSAMVLVSRPLTGKALDRVPASRVLVPALLLVGLGLVVLAEAHGHGLIVVAGLLCGAGLGMALAGGTVVTVQRAPAGRLPQAASTFYLSLDVSVALAPILLGLLIPTLGYAGLFRALTVVTLAAVALIVATHRRGLLSPSPEPALAGAVSSPLPEQTRG
jgi:predicted MFS family arabinose efflux permease